MIDAPLGRFFRKLILGCTVIMETSGADTATNGAAQSPKIVVREFQFTGNTVFSSAELEKAVSNYTGREIDLVELEDARRAVTLYYVNHGYINSGALLEDQTVANGKLTMRILEGKLSEIKVEGNKRLRSSYLKDRIERGAREPLNMNELQDTLLILKENPNVRRINAELKPTAVRGESELDVKMAENQPWRLGLQARNDRPPSVGAEVLELLAANENVSGHSDSLDFRYGVMQRTRESAKFSGVENLGAGYQTPLTAYDTSLRLAYSRGDFAIVEAPFDTLDIASSSDSYSLSLSQPIFKNSRRELSLSVTGDRRRSESFLLGQPFSFSAGSIDGKAVASTVRISAEYVDRNQTRVIAARSTFSHGLQVLGATEQASGPGAEFTSWLGQAQYVRRLSERGLQLIVGGSAQWTSAPLLSLEQFSLGGANSVRGYRENQLIRDMGILASVELRVPLLLNKRGGPLLQVAPFIDYGNGWNNDANTPEPRDICSAGAGLIFTPTEKIHAQLYWGYAFRDLTPAGGNDAQDLGLHFKVLVMAF